MASKKSKYRRAVGLQYDDGSDAAPAIAVKGQYLLADEVVRIAERNGVKVLEKPQLARALHSIGMDQEIPEELFEAVAVVLRQLDE